MIGVGNKQDDNVLPGVNQVHLWLLDLGKHRPETFSSDCMVLDDREKVRAREFRRAGDRQRYCLIRTVVRNVLSSYYPEVESANWRFSRNRHGKPGIASPAMATSLRFNISHSGRWLVMAVSQARKIGVDVERMSNERAMLAIAGRHFSCQECSYLCDLAPEKLMAQFYALWTLKEAYSKACGNALVPTLGELEFGFPGTSGITAVSKATDEAPLELTDWRFALFSLEGYRLALAMQGDSVAEELPTAVWEIKDPLKPGEVTAVELEVERLSH